jgi:hypothetical protein
MGKIKLQIVAMSAIGYGGFYKALMSDFKIQLIIFTIIYTLLFLSSMFFLGLINRSSAEDSKIKYKFPLKVSFLMLGFIGSYIAGIQLEIFGFVPFIFLFFYAIGSLNKLKLIR